MVPYQNVMRGFQNSIAEKTAAITQVVITITYVCPKVTTCLYRSPNKRARSLSTLMAVRVETDTPHKIYAVIAVANARRGQTFQRSFVTDMKLATARGSEIKPTQRSVVTRLRSRSLDGG